MKSPKHLEPRARGQATVEFALAIPVFLVMLMGIVDVGRVIWATTTLNAAATEGARYAIVHGGTVSDPCPVGPAGQNSNPAPAADCLYPSPSKQYVVNAALAAAVAAGTDIGVAVCYGTGCSGNADTGDNSPRTPVTVTISATVNLVTPSLVGISSIRLSGTSTMLVNH